jgi:CheY-like chemotaxis protein
MVHPFSLDSLAALVTEVENLLVLTGEQEARLSRASSLLPRPCSPADGAAALVEQASAEAREHRLRLHAALAALKGAEWADHAKQKPVVLVVNASADERDETARLLVAVGFRAITASNGLEAVIAAHCARPTVALIDVRLPLVDGVQTARCLKADGRTRGVPLIAYAAEPRFGQTADSLAFDVVLTKPTSADMLTQTVRYFLGEVQ